MSACIHCGRDDGRHWSWGLGGDVIAEVLCNGVFPRDGGGQMHCPNVAPIGGGGYCGPCRWSGHAPGIEAKSRNADGSITVSTAEMALETIRRETA